MHGNTPRNTQSRSYDYGSAIRETRMLSDKYDELKRQGMFLRSSPEFRKTDWIGESNSGIPGVSLSNNKAFVTYLKNPDTGSGFFITRQNDSTSMYVFSLPLRELGAHLALQGSYHVQDHCADFEGTA